MMMTSAASAMTLSTKLMASEGGGEPLCGVCCYQYVVVGVATVLCVGDTVCAATTVWCVLLQLCGCCWYHCAAGVAANVRLLLLPLRGRSEERV